MLVLVLMLCLGRVGAQDPAAPGSSTPTIADYTLGDTAFVPDNFAYKADGVTPYSVELTARVYYPADLSKSSYPVIIFLHGRHSTAYTPPSGGGTMAWPPVSPAVTIPSYKGYDYAGNLLASDGYIVVSISANGINSVDNNIGSPSTPDRGMIARASLIQKHLDMLSQFNTGTGPLVGLLPAGLAGKLDFTKIGTMGHSRGGEGVTTHYNYNISKGSPYTVKAVLPIAPVDYNRGMTLPVFNSGYVNGAALGVLLGYCDGDVSDNQGMHFYDDSRYSQAGDQSPKYFWEAMGSNHNFFNTVWTPGLFPTNGAASGAGGTADDWLAQTNGSIDPWAGPTTATTGRSTPAQQQAIGAAFITAFFRVYVGGETQFLPFLKGEAALPTSISSAFLFRTVHSADSASTRLDINRFTDPTNLTTDTAGGAVTQSGLSPYAIVGGTTTYYALPTQPAARQPGNTPGLYSPSTVGLSQASIGWSASGAYLQNALPAAVQDVSGYGYLQLRTALNFVDVRNTVAQDDFTVTLTDTMGHSASTTIGAWSKALMYMPGKVSRIPKVVLNAVRIPTSTFSGVDLTHVAAVQFTFDKQPKGAILLTDVAFAN